MPMAAKERHGVPRRKSGRPAMTSTTFSARAAKATRQNTTVSGCSSASATLAKKNDPPHRTDSDSNQIQTRVLIDTA